MSLTLIFGCMFSGKSTEILRRVRRYTAVGKTVTLVNSTKDVRCVEDVVCTHDKHTLECVKTDDISSITHVTTDVIVIDEGQFFTGLRESVRLMLDNGKHVIVSGLDGDFRQRQFGEIITLIPLADEVVKLYALCMVCRDGTSAPFTKRTVAGTDQEMVGANDKYMAVCRKHII
jgi:thymidine kinase